ncbi:hypothetical protein NDU88_005541 [Pleurodeles waltl]|uniref:SH3 domain-containing protein n=1 Tax=Pleurodeles waltl TaxID=8319 RepID=A0AAV7TUA0_PLEWA|nr:hypothetical protein NDU88_005541 [Pleurodeles waltl]
MDSSDYRQECLRLLSDTTYYAPVTRDPTNLLQTQIKSMIEGAKGNAWISSKEAEFLETTHPRTPYFYCLPKIHKGILPPPGHPIVSGIGSVLEPLSTFCDSFLQPLVKGSSTYLKDTKDVLNLIEIINSTIQVQVLELKHKLHDRHYPKKIVNPAYKRARNNPREALLAPSMREEQVRLACRCAFVFRHATSGRFDCRIKGRCQIEQVSQLASFIEAVLNYHKQSANILEDLHRQFQKQLNRQPPPEEPSHMTCPLTKEATCTGLHKSVRVHKETSREKGELQPKQTQPSGECSATHKKERHVSFSSGSSEQLDQPCCRALYDFEPENEGELRFKEGDIITLTNQLDDNWFEGMLNYESGFFPVNHVEVLVHLPK